MTMSDSTTAITGATALVGPELRPVENAVLIMTEGRISALGSSDDVAIPAEAQQVEARGMTLIPGFIDAHVHIGFFPPRRVLRAGVTTVRDLAWPPEIIFPMAERSKAPGFQGPLILAAGPMLTAPGGYPTRAGWAPSGAGLEVSGPEEAAVAVGRVKEQGAEVVKIALNPPAGPVLDEDTLKAIVSAAHERALEVTGHVYGLAELRKALDAGVDELAHMLMGTDRISPDLAARMAAEHMTVVPTLAIRSGGELKAALGNLGRFAAAGGRVVYGTDLGNAGASPGIDRREIRLMGRAGLSPAQIIESATAAAAAHLGLKDRGVLEVGAHADVVLIRGDPLADPKALGRVKKVWRAGIPAL